MKFISLSLAAAAAAALSMPSASLQSEITKHLDNKLLDGKSARYHWQPVQSSKVYCAHVNAKNRLGAYTGWRLFYVITDGSPVNAVFDNDNIALASMVCSENGYKVMP